MSRVAWALAIAVLPGIYPDATRSAAGEVVTALERREPPDPAAARRDPFRPPRAASEDAEGNVKSPLERYELGQLRLTAVIYGGSEPRAVVEDDSGLGYIVKLGTRIGPNGGKVYQIDRGRVTVREDYVDFYGEHRPTDVTLELKLAARERGKR